MKDTQETAEHIAEAYDLGRWLKGYIRGKLQADPVFNAGLEALRARSGRVVDLGCGLGLFGLWLRANGCQLPYNGCDLSEWKVQAGQKAIQRLGYADVSLSAGDMTLFPLEGVSTICAFDVLHYLPQQMQDQLVSRLAAAAREGALVLLRTGVRGCGWRSTMTALEEYWTRITGWIRGGNINFPHLQALVGQFEAGGCKVEATPLWGRTPFSSYWLRIS